MPLLKTFGKTLDIGILCRVGLIWGALSAAIHAVPAAAQTTAFKQAIAETAAGERDIAEFYRDRDYEDLWTGRDDADRLQAFLSALAVSDHHGLPQDRYDLSDVRSMLADVRSHRARGMLEVELTRLYLSYAADVQFGIVKRPSDIDKFMARTVDRTDAGSQLKVLSQADPIKHFRDLPPQSPEYTRLMAEKLRLERLIRDGGWGATVPGSRKLDLGDDGPAVVALRERLIRMGYMGPSAAATYDLKLANAVRDFQGDFGLEADGVAGPSTIDAINGSVESRLRSVVVAMERERWLPRERGERHIVVNLADFHARIIDHGKVTFQTRSVVGAPARDRQSPEFSDMMEHMVINPTWHVPRSIAVKEYLPQMQRNPGAASHLRLHDSRGRVVSRSNIDFTQYTARTFPFNLKEPPSSRNALGLVKFMFPNRHNVYLHDTPADHLFARQVRAFSHGCIRLNDPFEFAYALLARQTDDPKGVFTARLNSGVENVLELEQHVPVHLIYRTAFTQARGNTQFRDDIYGRDAKIWSALSAAGVVLPELRS